MQSVTIGYDKQDTEMPALGYDAKNVVHKEYLQSDKAKFGKVNISDINYYGMPVVIKDYIRDAFASAKKNNERLFLSHLTSTTHHPFGMPEQEEYVPLAAEKKQSDLSHYVNAVGYVDRWLGQILAILDEGVADKTLLVLVGDHGLSLPETGAVTLYYNGNVGNFHVPLVLSHPKLPPFDINDAAVSADPAHHLRPTHRDGLAVKAGEPRGARPAGQIRGPVAHPVPAQGVGQGQGQLALHRHEPRPRHHRRSRRAPVRVATHHARHRRRRVALHQHGPRPAREGRRRRLHLCLVFGKGGEEARNRGGPMD